MSFAGLSILVVRLWIAVASLWISAVRLWISVKDAWNSGVRLPIPVVHARIPVAGHAMSWAGPVLRPARAQKIGPRRARSSPRIPWSRRLPDTARRVQAALPLLPSASLAARRRRLLAWPLNRLDSPARSALRPWLLPEIFSKP